MHKISGNDYNPKTIASDGVKYLLGNGFIGYRGTLDEYTKTELTGINLPGFYDEVPGKWCESVNAPNPFYTFVEADGTRLALPEQKPLSHYQELDLKQAVFARETAFLKDGIRVKISSSRFVSKSDPHLLALEYRLASDEDISLCVYTGLDTDIWNLNGPHLEAGDTSFHGNEIVYKAVSREQKIPLIVRELLDVETSDSVTIGKAYLHKMTVNLTKNEVFTFQKLAYIGYGDNLDPSFSFGKLTYGELLKRHRGEWDRLWHESDVEILGDDEADLMLRYSIYHLLIAAPSHAESASIPARGLSAQVYKGAIFWDTEMFMLPFFLLTDPQTAKTLIRYRLDHLGGALAKALELGYAGAYYPWESVKDGLEGCSYFNVTDVFTNRPLRTYFRDRQIHISGDVVYGLCKYIEYTGDVGILFEGGLKVLAEVARFYSSYLYFKENKNRYEVLDVTGPDEYHERVNNNAFTNYLIGYSFRMFLYYLDVARKTGGAKFRQLVREDDLVTLARCIRRQLPKLYLPLPNQEGIIEQFDRYFTLEDLSPEKLLARRLHPNEYLGGASGIASQTRVIKQADVVTMLWLFKDQFTKDILKANFDYYEPRTEHGSSLSASMYSLLAIENGDTRYAYDYFMKSASIDYLGNAKEYAGGIYIGGSHPASAGGAFMGLIYGFLGFTVKDGVFNLNPRLPDRITEIRLRIRFRNVSYRIIVNKSGNRVLREENDHERKADNL